MNLPPIQNVTPESVLRMLVCCKMHPGFYVPADEPTDPQEEPRPHKNPLFVNLTFPELPRIPVSSTPFPQTLTPFGLQLTISLLPRSHIGHQVK